MEPIRSSETSATKNQTPGNHPKKNSLQLIHGENLKTRNPLTSEYFTKMRKNLQLSSVFTVQAKPLGRNVWNKNYLKTDLLFLTIFNSIFDKPVYYENKQISH